MSSPIHLLSVLESWDETGTLRGVRLAADPDFLLRYQVPGQYLAMLDAEGDKSYFALAAAPDLPYLELLLRRGSTLADAVAALPPGRGSVVRALGILGPGFPLAAQEGRDLILVGAGSGIAPLRAVVQQVLRGRPRFGRVALFYGQRYESELAYQADFAGWAVQGVLVEPVLSGGNGRRNGYVQEHLQHTPGIGPNTSAFLCGMRPMVNEARRALEGLGVPPGRIYLNH